MKANVTLSIEMDAYSPDLNDATVSVSHVVLDWLKQHGRVTDVVEHTAEKLLVTMQLDNAAGFPEIQP